MDMGIFKDPHTIMLSIISHHNLDSNSSYTNNHGNKYQLQPFNLYKY